MKKTALGTLIGLLGFVLLAEVLFRVLPVSTATKASYHIDPHILSYAPHLSWRYAVGWDLRNPQYLTNNGHGFVSDHEFKVDSNAVALIGDSYVEAASLNAADRPAAQLERALGGQRPVYAMGASGTALLDYAERIRYAHQTFGIRDFVVLMERFDVQQALCGSGSIHSQCLDSQTFAPRTERLAPPSAMKRLLRSSALAQYLVSQIKLNPARLLHQIFASAVPVESTSKHETPSTSVPVSALPANLPIPDVDAVTRAFFERVRPHVSGRLVIVVDTDRGALMHRRHIEDPRRQHFIALARAAGATVIDPEDMFRQHFEHSQLSLEIGPYDGHLNLLGVKLVADAIVRAFGTESSQ